MRFFKTIIAAIIVCITNTIDARTTAGMTTKPQQPLRPLKPSAEQLKTLPSQPKQIGIYKQLINYVKNSKNIITNGMLSENFINSVLEKAIQFNVHRDILNALLLSAAITNIQLSGNDQRDFNTLNTISDQINEIIEAFTKPHTEVKLTDYYKDFLTSTRKNPKMFYDTYHGLNTIWFTSAKNALKKTYPATPENDLKELLISDALRLLEEITNRNLNNQEIEKIIQKAQQEFAI